MAYSARLRKAVGAVRATLSAVELCDVQAPEFAQHGDHAVAADAPLVLVACSGGRDSMALAAVSHIVCTSMGVRCGVVIVDHGLQEGSEQVAGEAADRCRALGLGPVIVRNATVQARGEGLEAAARQARYNELCAAARESGAIAVLLAHTMDDQAETVLIGLLRSRGVDALAGMPQVFTRSGVTFARPLLTLTRDETTGLCEDLGVEYWDDPTNGDAVDGELPDDYPLRSRVRHDLLPAIERFAGFNVTRHFAESAQLARMDKEYLDQRSDEVMGEARRGRKIVLSGDTSPCEPLRVAAHEADLLVHEATFIEDERDRARETGHSTALQAAELAQEAEVRLLALTHLSTRYFGREIAEEATAVFPRTVVPRDFDVVDLPLPEKGEPSVHRLDGEPVSLG